MSKLSTVGPAALVRSRRGFLADAALLAASVSLGCSANDQHTLTAPTSGLSDAMSGSAELESIGSAEAERSGIEHVVLVMMENRSFDHLLGWLPHADGRQAGLRYRDRAGVLHATHPLAPDYQGCGFADPDHSYAGGRIEFDDGRCDGWLRAGDNDVYSIGYYQKHDLPFFGRAAMDYTTCDRYFAAILSETFPNRFYQHAAQTDRLSNTLVPSALPTIWDRLATRGVTGRYYFSDLPFLALWGPKYASITTPISAFYAAAASGTLPSVSFIDPLFGGEDAGTSGDDHPHGDIRTGESFLNKIYSALSRGPQWENTVLVINFDEWGGFFDHVPPPLAPLPDADRAVGSDGRRGFRTPALVISPFARRGFVSHRLFDHTSVLRMIEWRWGLEPLTVRDRTANNLADVLDFRHPERHAPQYLVPEVVGVPCPVGSAPIVADASVSNSVGVASLPATQTHSSVWKALRQLARANGFPGAE